MSQNRIVTLIDMDCFYCQVEARADPSLKGKPLAVVQYNQWKGGGIIAVNYEARNKGVNRGMRGDEAVKKCPDIKLVSVPELRGKADLTRYRNAGREVVAVLCKFSSCVEKASIDEAYIDLTDAVDRRNQRVTINKLKNTFVVGYDSENGQQQWLSDTYNSGMNDKLMKDLAQGAALVEEIRASVLETTGFHCSAGISHNKILAKLACGLHKPNRQTVLPLSSVPILYQNLPLKKIRSLGGKFGDAIRDQLGVTYMGEVMMYSLKELQQKFGDKSGLWLYNIARGIDSEAVKPRIISKSIGCCKNFKGPDALTTKKDVQYWISELAAEIVDRIWDDFIINERKATLLVVSAHQETKESTPFSRSVPLNNYDQDEIVRNAIFVLNKCNHASWNSPSWSPALKFLGLSASKFVEMKENGRSLLTFFKPVPKIKPNTIDESELQNTENQENKSELQNAGNQGSKPDTINKSELQNTRNQGNEQSEIENQTFERRKNDKLSELKIHDYHNSFFCKYFFGKRMRVASSAENETENDEIRLQTIPNEEQNSVENPIPSTSKYEPTPSTSNYEPIPSILKYESVPSTSKYEPIPSMSKNTGNPIPSTSREDDMHSIRTYYPSEKEEFSVNGKNSRSDVRDITEVCPECNRNIPLIEFMEHTDQHVAEKLQKELNSVSRFNSAKSVFENSRTGNNNTLSSTLSKKVGAKRKHNSSKTRSPVKRPLPITMFFKQQTGNAGK